MPIATLHLISLVPSTSLTSFLSALDSLTDDEKPVIVSKVVRWVITPEIIDADALLRPERPYELLLIVPKANFLPSRLNSKIHDHFKLQIGIPSRLLKDFTTTNSSLLHPNRKSIPSLTGALDKPLVRSSSQSLALSPELQKWIKSISPTKTGQNAVSMLNLLSFIPERKSDYLTYGKEFARSIGSKRGGNAKLVGHAVYPPSSSSSSSSSSSAEPSGCSAKWDEFALAHYPSILHFADMLASTDYQEVNQKYRVPSLKDTCILCTSEIEIEDLIAEKQKARL